MSDTSNARKEIVIWGGGKIGRGFIADIFHTNGYKISFIDADKQLVHNLKKSKQYTVINATGENEYKKKIINNFEVYHISEKKQIQEKVIQAVIVAIVVFPQVFESIANDLMPIIESMAQNNGSDTLDLLLCSNVFHPSIQFTKLLNERLSKKGKDFLANNVGLTETLLMRIAIEPTQEMKDEDPNVVFTNGYPEIPLDKTTLKHDMKDVSGIVLCKDIIAEEIRKMYTYNMAHALLAYLGISRGHITVDDCFCDDTLVAVLNGALEEISQGLQKEFGFTSKGMKEWNKTVIRNISNPILGDKLVRLASNPIRKLTPKDRLIGPAKLCFKNGILPYYLSKAIAYALGYRSEDDEASNEIYAYRVKHGLAQAIRHYCGLNSEIELIRLIQSQFEKVADNMEMENQSEIALYKKAYGLGFDYEKKYKGCAQCTILALSKITNMLDENLFQAASGLSGGMGLCGDGACGGYTAGILITGMYRGRRLNSIESDKEYQYKSYEMAQKLHDKFIETYGSVKCSDIHSCIFNRSFCLRTKPVRDEFEAAGAHADKCTTVIAHAAMWITQILNNEGLLE